MNNDTNLIFNTIFPPQFFSFLKTAGLFLLAVLWIFSVSFVAKDLSKRTKDNFIKWLFIVTTVALGPLGFLIYLIVRPGMTLAEKNQSRLESSLLIKEFESNVCSKCSCLLKEDYLFCPSCATRIASKCPNCNRIVRVNCKVCPYCGSKSVNAV